MRFLNHNQNRRFHSDNIYTNVGEVLISVNPYVDIPGLYEIPLPVIPPPPPSPPPRAPASPPQCLAQDEKTLPSTARGKPGRSPPNLQSALAGDLTSIVAERKAALLKGYENGSVSGHRKDFSDRRSRDGKGTGREKDSPKAKLAALKSLLGRPHVYGVADRAFQ